MIAGFSSKEHVSSLHYVDACARSNSIKELDSHGMHKLFSALKGDFVEISKLTLNEEKELVVLESCLTGEEQPTIFAVVMAQWNKAFTVFMINSFVDQEVLANYDDSTWAIIAWDLD